MGLPFEPILLGEYPQCTDVNASCQMVESLRNRHNGLVMVALYA